MFRKTILALVLLALPQLLFPLYAAFGPLQDPVKEKVYLDRDAIRPGERFRIALVLMIEESWHVYANPKGPGTGKPIVVYGKDAPGFHFLAARYLPGKKLSQEEIGPGDWVYAYEGEVPVYLEVQAAEDLKVGDYTLEVSLDALVCKESCIPVEKTIKVPVKVVSKDVKTRRINQKWFKDFERAKPAAQEAPQKKKAEEISSETLDFSMFRARPLSRPVTGLLFAIVFGFIAGIILNVMPCVLPVISIKVLSLVSQAHQERGRVFRLGLVFAAGIISVFLVLASLAAIAGYSWGEQFQSEEFIVAMIAVVFVFSLGLFDVYVILVPSKVSEGQGEGYLGSFFKGILTTFLATPCSGPFLGATLAWALTQKPAVIFAVFLSIGLGMATPYLLLSTFPGLLKFVPKPGSWMETFKHVMGFLLLATVVYLFSLLREELFVPTLAFCLCLGLASYVWGRFAHGAVPSARRWIIRLCVVAFSAFSAWFWFSSSPESVKWEDFSVQAFRRYTGLEGEGPRNLVIKFTADWCPNCKFVEKVVLERASVLAALRRKGAVLMKADITRAGRKHPAMLLMKQLGSWSIPFLAIFPANDPLRPFVLRDLYTRSQVLQIADKLPEPESGGKESAGG